MKKQKILKYLHDGDPWMLGEDIPDMDLFFSQVWLSCFVNECKTPTGRAYKKTMSVFKGLHLWFYFGEEDSKAEGDYLVKKFLAQPKFADEVNKQIIAHADRLRSFAETLPAEHLHTLTNRQLWRYYKMHDDIHTQYYRWAWIPVAVDMFHNNMTEKLKRYLRGINVEEARVNEYLMVLTQPTQRSLIQQEQIEFLSIAQEIAKDAKQKALFQKYTSKKDMPKLRATMNEKLLRRFQAFHERYFYVKFMWIGKEGVTSLEDYLYDMVELMNSGIHPAKALRDGQKEFKKTIAQRNALIKKLQINKTWRMLTKAWGDFMVTKIYRRYAQIYAVYRMQPVLREIAKRLDVSLKTVRLMLGSEIHDALLKNKIDRKNLAQRNKFFVYYTEKGVEKIFVGKEAHTLDKKLQPKKLGAVSEITGQIGCSGTATGVVKIVIRPKDMTKMNQGDILVSIATDPDIVPAMKKAAAIVTEQGGITSHAAIVSRELGIPCVIGTKIATQVLKDGDLVEVDANKGIVRKLK